MKLTRATFEDRYAKGTLRLAFVGMSNIGKSYTAMRLATHYDFDLIEVDKLIWEELGHSDMEAFAAWQGQPYSEGYAERETQSIALETKATQKAMRKSGRNQILDPPGSVIYTGKETLKTLRDNFYVVYIQASNEVLERLQIQYFKQPKPLIWKDHFVQNSGQSDKEAILSSYPNLLKARAKAYQDLADTHLSSEMILNTDVSIEAIYEALKPAI